MGLFTSQVFANNYSCSKRNQIPHSAKSQAPTNHYLDVLHYELNLDFTKRQQSIISGNALITARSLENRNQIRLDLLGLSVDSVLFNGVSKSFTHNSDSLLIDLNTTVATTDTFEIRVYYGGSPQQDASGWGGFYFSGNYSYNLGVGFAADPHNYGRVWYPCIDNFTDRATYEFNIKTDTLSKAICNGLLTGTINNGDGTQNWHWKLNQSIPTYLASVAVANYEFVEFQHNGLEGQIPVLLGGRANDTSNMKQSFLHLPDAIDAFEEMLGPYLWDRVGFVLVPFNSGAMEHATNIAFPQSAANGTLDFETLMTHEFAHNWWGNLITCETQEDMWINEGWATYMPILFDNYFYGNIRYLNSYREKHREVLQWAHIRDDGYKAISGISHEYTYGSHVYDKGADVAHTLMAYLKEDYFPCLKNLMQQKAFQNLNSEEFRDFLSQCSGRNLDDFFDNWVFNPGFPHFSVDSFTVSNDGNSFNVDIVIRQKTKAAPALFNNVPIEILIGNADNEKVFELNMLGSCGTYSASLDFAPSFVAIDPYQKIADATTDYWIEIDSLGNYNLNDALAKIEVTQAGSNKLQVTKHWIAPDSWPNAPQNLHISLEGYWSVKGLLDENTDASLELIYDGGTNGTNAHLDKDLLSTTEDNLVVLYRKNAAYNWAIADTFELIVGNVNDKRGRVKIPEIKIGEYALAIYDAQKSDSTVQFYSTSCQTLTTVGEDQIEILEDNTRSFNVYPNPSKDNLQIDLSNIDYKKVSKISIYSISGNIVWQKSNPAEIEKVAVSKWASAYYIVNVYLEDKSMLSKKIFVQ